MYTVQIQAPLGWSSFALPCVEGPEQDRDAEREGRVDVVDHFVASMFSVCAMLFILGACKALNYAG